MNALRARRLASSLSTASLPRALPPLARTGLCVSGQRSYFFDPIFLPVQEAVNSFHSATGIPWYMLIPASGLLHTLVFRMPSILWARRDNDKLLHGMLMAQSVRAATARAYGNGPIQGNIAPVMTSNAYKALGRTPPQMDPSKKLSTKVSVGVSFVSWFYSVSLFRRLTGGNSITGESMGVIDPSLKTEGCLWFPDLTVSDPTYILPVASLGMIMWSWMPRTEAGWRDVLGRPDPNNPSGLSTMRIRLIRLSLIGTPFFIAGFDALTAGSSFFVVSSLVSFRLLKLLEKKDPVTHMRLSVLSKVVADSRTQQQSTGKGKPINWFIKGP